MDKRVFGLRLQSSPKMPQISDWRRVQTLIPSMSKAARRLIEKPADGGTGADKPPN
jgi:hypothetical protein